MIFFGEFCDGRLSLCVEDILIKTPGCLVMIKWLLHCDWKLTNSSRNELLILPQTLSGTFNFSQNQMVKLIVAKEAVFHLDTDWMKYDIDVVCDISDSSDTYNYKVDFHWPKNSLINKFVLLWLNWLIYFIFFNYNKYERQDKTSYISSGSFI